MIATKMKLKTEKKKTIKQYQQEKEKEKLVVEHVNLSSKTDNKKFSAEIYYFMEICKYATDLMDNHMEKSMWVDARKHYYADILTTKFLSKYEIHITKSTLLTMCKKYLTIEYIQSMIFPSHPPCIPYIGLIDGDPYTILHETVSSCPICSEFMRFRYDSGCFIIQYVDNIYILFKNTIFLFTDSYLYIDYKNIMSFTMEYNSSYYMMNAKDMYAHVELPSMNVLHDYNYQS